MTTGPAAAAVPELAERLEELLLDADFVDAEFEAIMTANGFGAAGPVLPTPGRGDGGRGPVRPAPERRADRRLSPRAGAAHVPGRQRSPPRHR